MTPIFIGILGIILSIGLAFFWGYAESMATAPNYTETPLDILIVGIVISLLIISIHWW